MANQIQHKRSTSGGATPTLTAGELAFNLVDKRVFTANATTVFDAFQNTVSNVSITSDGTMVLRVGNTTTNAVVNSTALKFINSTSNTMMALPTAAERGENRYLKVDGTWSTVSATAAASGADQDVQFNDGGTNFGANVQFKFNKTTTQIVLGNTTSTQTPSIKLANSTVNTTIALPTSANYSATNVFLHANGSWVAVSGGGGSPGGSNTYIQYNDSGAFNGSAGFTFDETTNNVTIANTLTVNGPLIVNSDSMAFGNSTVNAEISSTQIRVRDTTGMAYLDHEGLSISTSGPDNIAVPAEANSYTLFSKYKAGRALPITIGSSGWDTPLSPHFAHNSVHYLYPNPGATTTAVLRATSANTVAFTARTPSSANVFMSQPRNGQTTGATAGTSTSWRNTILSFWRGNAAGRGGFYAVCRFGVATSAAQGRVFVGFKDSATILSNGNPSAQTNIIGFGWDSAVTNVHAMSSNSTAGATTIDLGGDFPTGTGNTNWYEGVIFARPGGGTVSYQLTNLTTGIHAYGDYNQSNLPSNTTFMTWQFWCNNGSTAGAQIMDWGGVFIELPY